MDKAKLTLGSAKHIQSDFNIFFARKSRIVELSKEISEALKSFYLPAQELQVPQGLDVDLPRLALVSQHGSSHVLITATNVSLNVQYTPSWQLDFTKGYNYIEQRVPHLIEAVSSIDSPLLYMGMSSTFRMEFPDQDQLARYLGAQYAEGLALETPHEISLRVSNVLEEKYFSNVSVRNYRRWQSTSSQLGVLRLSKKQAEESGLEVTLDLNDRYAYNEVEGYQSQARDWHELMAKFMSTYSDLVERMSRTS